ncbi:MAG: hypothetical protein ACRAUW_13510 [Aeromonas sp.]
MQKLAIHPPYQATVLARQHHGLTAKDQKKSRHKAGSVYSGG